MKKLFIGLAAVAFSGTLVAQINLTNHPQNDTTLYKNIMATSDSLHNYSGAFSATFIEDTTKGILDEFVFNKFLENKFTYLSFERGALPTTNSAAIDLSENDTKLKLSFAKKWLSETGRINKIVSLGTNVKLGDGIANLFKGNTATTGTTFFLNFSFLNAIKFKTVKTRLIDGKRLATPFGNMVPKLQKVYDAFSNKYDTEFRTKYIALYNRLTDINDNINSGKVIDCCDSLNRNKIHYQSLVDSLEALFKVTKLPSVAFDISTLKLRIEHLDFEICKCTKEAETGRINLYSEKDVIEKQLSDAGFFDKEPSDIADGIAQKYQEKRFDIFTKSAPWEWYKLSWFNAGITYTRDAYTTYNKNEILSKRFGSQDFNSWGFKLTQNWYQEKSQKKGILRAWYANISYEPSLINSYSDLADQDILRNAETRYPGDTVFVHQVSKKARDISGIPYTTTWQHGLSGAFTAMLFDKSIGVDLLFKSAFSHISKPVFNSKFGVIFSLNNSNYDGTDEKSKSKVNFEFFIQFPDMSDTGNSGKSVWQNRVVGISTNIPFNKIFLN